MGWLIGGAILATVVWFDLTVFIPWVLRTPNRRD